MSSKMDALRDGTTWYQQASPSACCRGWFVAVRARLGQLQQHLPAHPSVPYRPALLQEQAEKLKSLDMWRASIVACTKATALLVLTGCAYVNLFM